MSLQNIPCEILEKIFIHLDGISLARATSVCSAWKSVIRNMAYITNMWKKCVIKEIPKEILLDLVGGVEISSDSKRKISNIEDDRDFKFSTLTTEFLPIDWCRIYKMWYFASKIESLSYSLESVPTAGTFPVTCCKVSGSWVLTGHTNGSVCTWDWTSGALRYVIIQHLKRVTDFALFDLLKNDSYGSPLSPFVHHHIVSVSNDTTIQISPLFNRNCSEPSPSDKLILRYHSCSLNCVRTWGNSFAVNCADNIISVWRLAIPDTPWSKATVEKTYILDPSEHGVMRYIGFWKNQISGLCYNGKFLRFSRETNQWFQKFPAGANFDISDFLHDSDDALDDIESFNSSITNANIFWDNMVFLFSFGRDLWVSIDGHRYQQYRIMETLGSSVARVCLRGGLLAIGLECGTLALFKISGLNDLLILDIRQPAWRRQLSEGSILSIDISHNHEGYPIVIASTTETTFIINWKLNE